MEDNIVIDADKAVLGRVAALAAKSALQGKNVAVVNCDNAIISGTQEAILANYIKRFQRGKRRQKGPYYTRTPFRLMKRTIRGMLPFKQQRGKIAFTKIKCYNDVPAEFQSTKKIQMSSNINKFLTLKRLFELIGR
jgi:large subunit ribosomal protein L13